MAEPSDQPVASSSMDLRDTQPHMVAKVRHWVAVELAGLAEEVLGDILLVVTELVTNAYDHGGGPALVRLIRSRTPWSVTIEVDDASPVTPTVGESRFGTESCRGNGLVLVDKLSTSWGVRPLREGGKTVWAKFARRT